MIAVVIAAITYTATALFADVPFTAGGLLGSATIAAFSAVVTFGIGEVANGIVNLTSRVAFETVANGVFQGTMTSVQGGNFWNGMASGAIGSLGATLYGGSGYTDENGNFVRQTPGLNGVMGTGDGGMIAFGAISGGAGAALTGGNFWQGAATGLVVAGFNHAMHDGDDDNGYDKNGKQVNDKGGDNTDYRYDENGAIIGSTSVMSRPVSQSEFATLHGFRGYGVKGYAMNTVAIDQDNTFFEFYAGGKVTELGLSCLGKQFSLLRASITGEKMFNSKLVGGTSKLFGRGKLGSFGGKANGVLNRNANLRAGWSWNNELMQHEFQFRTGSMYGAKHHNPFFTYKP